MVSKQFFEKVNFVFRHRRTQIQLLLQVSEYYAYIAHTGRVFGVQLTFCQASRVFSLKLARSFSEAGTISEHVMEIRACRQERGRMLQSVCRQAWQQYLIKADQKTQSGP